jgi:hypothetical protein
MVDVSSAQRITGFSVMVALQSSAGAYVSRSDAFFSCGFLALVIWVPILRPGVAALFG